MWARARFLRCRITERRCRHRTIGSNMIATVPILMFHPSTTIT